jgi:hypothetical protein
MIQLRFIHAAQKSGGTALPITPYFSTETIVRKGNIKPKLDGYDYPPEFQPMC